MLTRTLTPERWLISGERRASCVSSAMSSSMKRGSSSTGHALAGERRPLLEHDRDLVLDRARIVRPDLRAEAVLERRDDPAAAGVVLRVGAGDDEQVERQAQRVAAHLDVALLEDVEQADLDALGEVGQLVDREDAAVGARDEAVVDGRRVGQVAALGDLDRVDLADQVGDGDVGRGQLLAVAAVARQPLDGRLVAFSSTSAMAVGLIGASGSSLSSPPATTGMTSSSRPTSSRASRVLAWPRSPRKQMSWPARIAFSIGGMTLSS